MYVYVLISLTNTIFYGALHRISSATFLQFKINWRRRDLNPGPSKYQSCSDWIFTERFGKAQLFYLFSVQKCWSLNCFLDQYNSLRANKSAVPLCSEAETVKEISSTERTALMMTQEVSYKCPPPCTTNQYEGSVTRFQSGEGKLRNGNATSGERGAPVCRQ